MTAEPLKPLPCPWCQKPPTIRNVFNMFGMVESADVYCPEHTHGFRGKTQQEAIAAWNRREPIGISDELRLKIEEYINWINAHRDDSGYLNPLYGSQIEAFEIVLDWIDELSLRREDAE